MQYFITIGGQVIGPMYAQQVFAYNVNAQTSVSVDGTNWAPLYTHPELMQILHQQQMSGTESKRVLCGIMAMIFGTLGVQYFIMGKVGAGLITILLSLVTCGTWEIITFIQGILMLCMSDEEFNRKYVESTSTLPLF